MANSVESSNIVGYSQVTIPAQQFTMIGIPFSGTDGTAINVQDLFADPIGQGLTGGANAAQGDQLMYWDPNESGSYAILYLYNSTLTSSAVLARKNKWLCSKKHTDTSWGSGANAVSAKTLTPGMGLWLKRVNYAEPITLTMAGQVVVAQSGQSVAIREGFNMISGGFTAGFAPNVVASGTGTTDIDWLAKGCQGGANAAQGDQIMFWDTNESGSYAILYLYNSTLTSSAVLARKNKWLCSKKHTDTSWGSGANVVSPKVIPMGRGFWYKRVTGAGAFTLTLDQPYTLAD